MRFFKKKKKKEYDHEKQVPVIRKSICTGEETAGFQNKETGHFEGVLLIRNDRDLAMFMDEYGLKDIPKTIY